MSTDAGTHSVGRTEVNQKVHASGDSYVAGRDLTIITARDPSQREYIRSQRVFVVHGRNNTARIAMFAFLRSIGLLPIEWSQALEMTGRASPYVGEVLDSALNAAQAVLVLMTPDEIVSLRPDYADGDDDSEVQPSAQARPNVLFEAGLALGRAPDRTVLVEFGKVRPFSDIAGRHILRINDSVASRQALAHRLKTAGCAVDLIGTDWHTAGAFTPPPLLRLDSDTGHARDSQDSASTVPTPHRPPKATKEKILFGKPTMKRSSGKYRSVVGEVTNNDDIEHSVTIVATFYDSDRAIIGTAFGHVSDLDAGQTKTFDLRTTDDVLGYTEMKLQIERLY